MSLYAYPKWFRFLYRAVYKVNYAIQSRIARGIFTVSDFSKSEIEKYLGVDPDKITVLPNSVDTSINLKNHIENEAVKHKEILLVGTLEPRKNIEFVINAFLNSKIENYKLIVVGG